MRDPSGRSLHDRDTGAASETRQMGEADRRAGRERAAPYLIVVAVVAILVVALMLLLR